MKLLDRIDAALEKMAFERMEVRAIYLTEDDHDQFDREMSKLEGFRGSFLCYRDHQIRRSERASSIFSTHCIERAIPKRLSAKVA